MNCLALTDLQQCAIDIVNKLMHNSSSHGDNSNCNILEMQESMSMVRNEFAHRWKGCQGSRPARRARATAECRVEASSFDIAAPR